MGMTMKKVLKYENKKTSGVPTIRKPHASSWYHTDTIWALR